MRVLSPGLDGQLDCIALFWKERGQIDVLLAQSLELQKINWSQPNE
jgi:hypothetical protein